MTEPKTPRHFQFGPASDRRERRRDVVRTAITELVAAIRATKGLLDGYRRPSQRARRLVIEEAQLDYCAWCWKRGRVERAIGVGTDPDGHRFGLCAKHRRRLVRPGHVTMTVPKGARR